MLQHTRGITLKTTKYADNGIVAQIYTEDLGLQSFLINGARKPRAKIHINMLQPLHLLDMVVYHNDKGNLQRIKEASQTPILHQIPLDMIKGAMAMFINEVLYKVLRHQHGDKWLFSFLVEGILWLDQTKLNIANFHLIFLINLSKHLGFYPTTAKGKYFDLAEGIFTDALPKHPHFIAEPHVKTWRKLMESNYETMQCIRLHKDDRKYLLAKMLDFYRLHTEHFGEVNSLVILEEVFVWH